MLPLQENGQNQHEKGGWAFNTSWAYNTYSTVIQFLMFFCLFDAITLYVRTLCISLTGYGAFYL